MLRPGHTRIRFAVLDHRPTWTIELVPLPEALEDPLKSRSLVGTAEKAGAGCPADPLPLTDIDHHERSL